MDVLFLIACRLSVKKMKMRSHFPFHPFTFFFSVNLTTFEYRPGLAWR